MTTALPFQAKQPIFSKMGGISELSHLSSEERRVYFNSLNTYRTNRATYEFAGIEGEMKKAKEIARNLKSMGLSIEQIQSATGLTIAEIENL